MKTETKGLINAIPASQECHQHNQPKQEVGGYFLRTSTVAKNVMSKIEESKENISQNPLTPKKYHPITDISPKSANTKNVIYVILDKKTNRRYVGQTSRELKKRANEHVQSAKNAHIVPGQTTNLHTEMRKRPDDFVIGILIEVSSPSQLDSNESDCIKKLQTHIESIGFNGNKGKKRIKREKTTFLKPIETPKKNYPFEKDGKGKIRAMLTPSVKKAHGGIYRVKRKDNLKCYYGQTWQTLQKRFNGHAFFINNPHTKRGQKELYKQIRECPELFEIGIVAIPEDNKELNGLEKSYIFDRGSRENGFNDTCGGGLVYSDDDEEVTLD